MTKIFQHFYETALPAGQSFARASVATHITSAGQIALTPADTPRFEANGLYIEPAAIQHIASPADLGGPGWATTGGVFTPNLATLWGLFTVGQISTNGAIWHNRNTLTPAVSAGETRSYAYIVKAGGTDPSGKVRFVFDGGGTPDASSLTGAIGSDLAWNVSNGSNVGALTQEYRTALADGWYLYQFSITFTAAYSSVTVRIGAQDDVAGRTVLVAGANSTNLDVPSSFITGASRAADMLGVLPLGTALAEGAFMVGAKLPYPPMANYTLAALELSTDTGQSVSAGFDFAAGSLNAVAANGTEVSNLLAGLRSDGRLVLAQRFKTNDFAASANGAAALIDSDGISPTVDRLSVGATVFSAPTYIDYIAVHDAALTNAALTVESARALFQRDSVDVNGPSSELQFKALNHALFTGVRQVLVAGQQVLFSGSGFLAKPAALLRRYSVAERTSRFKPKP